jgi:integrase
VLVALQAELRNSAAVNPMPKSPSATDYAERWLEAKAARVRPSVAAHRAQVLSDHILPHFGDRRVDQITRLDVEAWAGLIEKKRLPDGRLYARETILGFWRIFRTLIKDAVADLGLSTDPTDRVRPPDPAYIYRREQRTLLPKQLRGVVAGVEQYAPQRLAETFVLAYSGIRAGEMFALRWKDIDEKGRFLNVRRSVRRGQVSAVKTKAPRTAALPVRGIALLRKHRQVAEALGRDTSPDAIVFPADNGSYRMPQSLHKPLALASEAAGLDIRVTPQVFRRTFNTLSVACGIDRIVLRSQMGHSSEAMTRRYSGIPIEAKLEAVDRLVELTDSDE